MHLPLPSACLLLCAGLNAQTASKPVYAPLPGETAPAFQWSAPGDPYLQQLRQTCELERLRKARDLETVKAVCAWVHGLWQHNGSNEPTSPDPLTIITEAKAGKRFRCVEYGIVVKGCLEALGIPARVLSLKTADVETREMGAGHVVAEAYLRDRKAWMMIDGQFGAMPMLKGDPLSALALQQALGDPELAFEGLERKGWDAYKAWIAPYLYFFDVAHDNRGFTWDKLKGRIQLAPTGVAAPKVFQRVMPFEAQVVRTPDHFYPTPEVWFSREALIQDARHLARTLEEAHPDPYTAFGGRIAFHRAFQERLRAIPEQGLTTKGFYDLFAPFVARLEDMHTGLRRPEGTSGVSSSGLPFRFKVVGPDLVVMESGLGAELLGARLEGLEGRAMPALRTRLREVVGCENTSHESFNLVWRFQSGLGLEELLPGWKIGQPVSVQFRLPDGTLRTEAITPADLPPAPHRPATRVQGLPDLSKTSLGWSFLDAEGRSAYLAVTDCVSYRENVDLYLKLGGKVGRERLESIFKNRYERMPKDDAELKASFPSALDTFVALARAMKIKGTQRLVVDLRENGGGNSLVAKLLVYVLQGPEGLAKLKGGYSIVHYSQTLLDHHGDRFRNATDAGLKLELGDYNFSSERSFQKGSADPEAWKKAFQDVPAMVEDFKAPKLAAIYCPPTLAVLSSARTGSSGFDTLLAMQRIGATSFGTASSQAPNCFIDAVRFTLPCTGLTGNVAFKAQYTFPDDPVKGRMLPCDVPLTFDRLKALAFDPNAEILMALEATR